MGTKYKSTEGAEFELSGVPSLFWASNRETRAERSFVRTLLETKAEIDYTSEVEACRVLMEVRANATKEIEK